MKVTARIYFSNDIQQKPQNREQIDSNEQSKTLSNLPSPSLRSARHRVMKNLRTLQLPQVFSFPPEIWGNVISHVELDIKKLLRQTSHVFERLTSAEIKHIKVHDRTSLEDAVTVFQTGGVREITLTGTKFRDDDLALLGGLPGLQRLSLQCPHIGEAGLNNLAHKFPRLRSLDLNMAPRASAKFVVDSYPKLEHLGMPLCEKLRDADLRYIVKKCARLRSLNIARCPNLTGSILTYLSYKCRDLTMLNMAGNEALADGLRDVKTFFPSVKSLDISEWNFDGELVAHVTNVFPSLVNLSMESPKGHFGDAEMRQIVTAYRGMTGLSVRNSGELSANGFESIADECAYLEELDLGHCKVDGKIARCFADKCRNLIRLDLTCCSDVKDDDLKYLVTELPHLTELILKGCEGLTVNGVADIRKQRPDLRIEWEPRPTACPSEFADFALPDAVDDWENTDVE